jgi:hypothetical protein
MAAFSLETLIIHHAIKEHKMCAANTLYVEAYFLNTLLQTHLAYLEGSPSTT